MDIQNKTKEEHQKELTELKQEFYYLNAIKEIDSDKRIQLEQELATAYQEIKFQNEEKEKRVAELFISMSKAEESETRLKLATKSGQFGIWDWNVKKNVL